MLESLTKWSTLATLLPTPGALHLDERLEVLAHSRLVLEDLARQRLGCGPLPLYRRNLLLLGEKRLHALVEPVGKLHLALPTGGGRRRHPAEEVRVREVAGRAVDLR